jgi:hypothetical protein
MNKAAFRTVNMNRIELIPWWFLRVYQKCW